AWGIRNSCFNAGGGGYLWRDVVCRGSTNSRDRNSHRIGSTPGKYFTAGLEERFADDDRGPTPRRCGSVCVNTIDEESAVRCYANRPADVCCRLFESGGC